MDWRKIPGLPARFEYSIAQQSLRSLTYTDESGKHRKARVFQERRAGNLGYVRFKVRIDGVITQLRRSRIASAVAEGSAVPAGVFVDHINMIRDDDRPENLRRCTHKENLNFAVQNGRFSAATNPLKSGRTNPRLIDAAVNRRKNPKLTAVQVLEMKRVAADGLRLSEVEKQVTVAVSTVSRILSGKLRRDGAWQPS